jgi:hypothetical protein
LEDVRSELERNTFGVADVGSGSDSEVVASPSYVRFTPRSGGKAEMPIPTLWDGGNRIAAMTIAFGSLNRKLLSLLEWF